MATSPLDCPDGCGLGEKDMDADLIAKVQAIHAIIPLRITSGIRCEKHNIKIGGATRSYHIEGKAIDFVPFMGLEKCWKRIIDICKDLGIIGIRIYPVHVHVDSRAKPHSWIHANWRDHVSTGT